MCLLLSTVFFSFVQAQLPVLTARFSSKFGTSAHISLHKFSVLDTLFGDVFHTYFRIQNWQSRRRTVQSWICHAKETSTLKLKWMTARYSERLLGAVVSYDWLMVCVGHGEVNITKLPQKVPDGDFQSDWGWGIMPHIDRIILIDGCRYFKRS